MPEEVSPGVGGEAEEEPKGFGAHGLEVGVQVGKAEAAS
jgi:hypothetical protein